MIHPASKSLREIADWLDQHGQNVRNISVNGWMLEGSPEKFVALRAALPRTDVEYMNLQYPSLISKFSGTRLSVHFDKKLVCVAREVIKSELVLPEVTA